MRYYDARSNVRTGDLLAWSHGGWTSWHDIQVNLVRMFTRSEYSHVGVAYVTNDRVFILEAVGAGVRMFPLSRELPFYWVRCPKHVDGDAIEFAFERLGDRYSKWQAVLAGLGLLKTKTDNLWECAEYVLAIYRRAGIPLRCDAVPTAVVRAAIEQWERPIYFVTGD